MGLFRNADFRNLWAAQTVSLVGTQVTLLAFPLAALLLGGSALEVSLLAAVEFAPVLLLGLPAGAWVERMSRRRVLIGADLARAAALAVVPAAYALDMLSMPLLYGAAFVIGLATLFFDVAQLSYLPALVAGDELTEGNAKLESSRSLSQLAGPGLGGGLVQVLTAPVAIVVDAFSYLLSAAFLLRIKRPEPPPAPPEGGLRQEIAEGLRFVFTHPLLRPITLAAAAAELAFAAVLALQVVYGVDDLKLSAGVIGLAIAAGNAGGLIGAMLAGRAVDRFGPGPALIAAVALFSAGAVMLPLAGEAVMFGAGLFVVYLGVVVFNVIQVTLCQTATPARLLSRMNATLRFITWGMVPIGAAAGGVLTGALGVRGVLWAAAAVCALSIVPPCLPAVRGLRTYPEPQLTGARDDH
ncbi:MFS transporter [Nonomuraea typhae]|uniref:MFS transporter n=1 Tax=Nonomuraea typhae TaxID=2603600 RepID=A0ABW7YSX7_9ACTN